MNDTANIVFQWGRLPDLTSQQLFLVMRARQLVFIEEQQIAYVDADPYDELAWHLIAWGSEQQAEIAGYLRVLPPGAKYPDYASFGRVLTTAQWRGSGIGKRLVQEALRFIDHQFPGSPIKISAQAYLERFYRNLGFVSTTEPYIEEGIPHLGMTCERDTTALDLNSRTST